MAQSSGWTGEVVAIHMAANAEGEMRSVENVEAVAGRGLVGDRYYLAIGTYSDKGGSDRQVTLVETEALEGLAREYHIELLPGASRRNITTRGVALNHLVDREFTVGPARLRGLRLCEPCKHLEAVVGLPVRPGLVHRGGLRCEILAGGEIGVGDAIQPASG
jgi:MOSC domain-containing protein YiiM